MKTVILYYSVHHGNTKKLVDAIVAKYPEVTCIDTSSLQETDLNEFDLIGLASGIYGSRFSQHILDFAKVNLPRNKNVFFLFTSTMNKPSFLKGIREVTEAKQCREVGYYGCKGFDTFGPFKLIHGIGKGHPDEAEIRQAVDFFASITKE